LDDFAAAQNVSVNLRSMKSNSKERGGKSLEEYEMWDDWEMGGVGFELEDGEAEILLKKRQEFAHRMATCGLWGGMEAPNEEDGMRDIEELWEEEDDDDLLTELLREIGEQNA